MEIPSELSSVTCTNCNKTIPLPNIDLHLVHCARNLEKCRFCGENVQKRHAERHHLSRHALVACRLCSETVERENLSLHRLKTCPWRTVACEFCNSRTLAVDLFKRQEVRGKQIEGFHRCNRDIKVARRLEGARRRGLARACSQRHLLVKIAIAGAIIVLGSVLNPKKV